MIGCKRDPQTGNISVVSAWNPTPRHAPNKRDPSQSGVCPYHASYTDGQLSCRFSRYIAAVNPGYDYDLNNSYFLFLAISDRGGSPHFLKHKEIPLVSDNPTNVLFDNNTAANIPRSDLVKAHAALMMLACPLLFGIVVLFGVPLMKSISIENYLSRKDLWHLLRIILGISALSIMVIGTILAVSHNRHYIVCAADIAHFVLGGAMLLTVGIMLLLDSLLWRFEFQLTSCFLIGCIVLMIEDFLIPFSLLLFQDGCGPDRPDFIFDVLLVHLVIKAVLLLVVLALYLAFMYYRRQSELDWRPTPYWQNLFPLTKVVGGLFGLFAFLILSNFIVVLTLIILFSINP